MNVRSSSDTGTTSLRERIRQATVAAILDAAEQIFAEQGLDGGRMNDIATRAGVAVGTLYNHFEDRDALFSGLLLRRKLDLIDLLDAVLAEPHLDFRAQLERMFEGFFAFVKQHRGFYALYMQCEVSVPQGDANQIGRELYLRMEKLVKRGIREKVLRPSGAKLYPALLMGTIRALFIRERIYGVELTMPDVKEALRVFLEGAGA